MYIIDQSQAVDEAFERTHGKVSLFRRKQEMGHVLHARPLTDSVAIIPKAERLERIKHMTANGGFPNQRRKAIAKRRGQSLVKDQDGLGYCHLFALTSCVEDILYGVMGLDYEELAPESLAGVVNWKDEGGVMDEDIAWAYQHGIAKRSFCPKLNHNPRDFKAGWDTDALLQVPLEWYELGKVDMWEEVATALCLGYPVYPGFMWWGHSVMAGALNEAEDLEIENSWTPAWGEEGYGWLQGKKKVPDSEFGCFALRLATWSHSA